MKVDQVETAEGEVILILTPNEIRRQRGLAPVEGGDDVYIKTPMGYVPLSHIKLYFDVQEKK